jgi:hypothetical protein
MLEAAIEQKRKREELKGKRDLLFERYLKLPMDTRLAIEIRTIDDQIAEHTSKLIGRLNAGGRFCGEWP